MKILGIHLRTHDAAVAYIENDKIIYASSNERFSRIKMDRNAPVDTLRNLFNYVKIKPKDIDIIIYVDDPFPKALWTSYKENSWPITSTQGQYLFWLKKPLLILAELFLSIGIPSYVYRFIISKRKIEKLLKGFRGKIYFDHHHFAHLHSAYYVSGWSECLVMANEGSGFTETLTIYHVKDGKWKKIIENKLPHSMGKFYELITELLGFNRHRHPGKITGLSAYGDPQKAYKFVKELMWVEKDRLKLNNGKYLKLLSFYLLNKRMPPELASYKREDLAAAFQKRLEECLVDLIKQAVNVTGIRKIAIAGGVSANVKANQRIHEIKGISDIYIHQAMGDDGLALGAALHASWLNGYHLEQPDTVYFGPDFNDKEIEGALKKYKLIYKKINNIEKRIAKLISEKKVVARFFGRMEYGPRALGNRSILYEAKDKSVNDWLNKRLKRTEFMPFAPVTLEKYANRCYKNLKGAEYPARFMAITFDCTEYMKKVSPACVHVDGTARPQILRHKDNPSYYKILEEYYKITGIPSLVNTSFNMHEEPIVCTPDDAIRAFLSSRIDYLAIGNYLVYIQDNMNVSENYKSKVENKKRKNNKNIFMEFIGH